MVHHFEEGKEYLTIDNVVYTCVEIAEEYTKFVKKKDGWTVEAYDARFRPDGRICWGSTYGYYPR